MFSNKWHVIEDQFSIQNVQTHKIYNFEEHLAVISSFLQIGIPLTHHSDQIFPVPSRWNLMTYKTSFF